jgi:glutamyl-tRNA reductase
MTGTANIVLLGVNHKTAPVELRERLAIPSSRLAEATLSLVGRPGVREGMILCTCNRVEMLTCQESPAPDLLHFIHEYFSIDPATLRPHVYEYREREAVRHLFRVAASLDSMVVGEPQILGQVKQSYSVARDVGAVQGNLDLLLQRAFSVAKRVRTETQIGSSSVSIASVAVELASKIFGSLEGTRVLLVGAGKMSEVAARHLIAHGAHSIMVANRTRERAAALAADFDGETVDFDSLYDVADRADIVITSTGSEHPIFRREHGQTFLHRRRNRPMFFIDIAVPRDVDPEMNRLDGIFVYNIDDLQSVATSHHADRAREAEQAEGIISREVERFDARRGAIDVAPAMQRLQHRYEQAREAELRRMASRLKDMTPQQREAVDTLTRGLVNKLMHPPMQAINAAAREGDAETIERIGKMFDGTTGEDERR